MSVHKTFHVLAGLAVIFLLSATSFAATLEELQERFKQRYPRLVELKEAGTIGETWQGYVEFVDKTDPGAQDIVQQENSDRRELYRILAEREKTTPDVVAQRNAQRNFQQARSGEYLKHRDGWKQKG
jgi:uncharacterized protein